MKVSNFVLLILVSLIGFTILAKVVVWTASKRKVAVVKTIPEIKGSKEINKPKEIIRYDTIYRDTISIKRIKNPINKDLLSKYEAAKTEIERLKLYKKAIEEREYKELLSDSLVNIEVFSNITGKLNHQRIKYTLKERKISFKVPKKDKFGVFLGAFSTYGVDGANLGVDLNVRKDNIIYKLGYTTNSKLFFGVAFKLF